MTRLLEEYRQHTLLAAIHKGSCRGRVWRMKEIVYEQEGESPESLIKVLRDWVDSSITERATTQGENPDYDQLLRTFQQLLPSLTDNQLVMLKEHYKATNQVVSMDALAEAAGFPSFSGANLQYGLIGKSLQQLAPINLPKRKDGTYIYTSYLASPAEETEDEGYWQWKLRPEVAKIIEHLGLNA